MSQDFLKPFDLRGSDEPEAITRGVTALNHKSDRSFCNSLIVKARGLSKNMLMRLELWAFLFLFFATFEKGLAQVETEKSKRSSIRTSNVQVAIVQDGGTDVFPEASFDSDPIAYLNPGQKIKISRKKYPGSGGFGLFYKVSLGKGKSGYISDVEVVPQFTQTKFTQKVKQNPEFEELTQEPQPKLESMLFTRFLALNLASIQYKEKFSPQDLSAPVQFFGLKMTGPGYLFEEIPLDIDLLISPKPPAYYDDKLATAPSTGFLLFSSVSLKFPFIDLDNSQVYYSLGLFGNYSNYSIKIGSNNFDSQELKLGVVGGVGAAMRFHRKYFIQSDARYYHEKTKYWGYSFSFGLQY